jgi:hypothetical protein
LCIVVAVLFVLPVIIPDHDLLPWLRIPSASLLVLTAVYIIICNQCPALVISEAGLKVAVGIAPIPWGHIEQVSIGSFLWIPILKIKFVDPKRFMAQRPIFRFFRFYFRPKEDYDFAFSIDSLEAGRHEIVSAIENTLSLREDR